MAEPSLDAPLTRSWALPRPYDLQETVRLLRTGSGDPTVRRVDGGLWRTASTAEGPVTVHLQADGEELAARAWGPGAGAALDEVPRWVGLHEEPWTLPPHPVTDELLRRFAGLRSTDTRMVFEALVPVILQQLVTWNEAASSWRRLCEELGEPAPDPAGLGLRIAPTPEALRRAGQDRLRSLGVRHQQARALLEAARVAPSLQKVADLSTAEATRRLLSVRGIGPWSAAYLLGLRLGRPEPVLVGDYHLPSTVAWALAGEERATDERMLELLAPFEGHAFRVVRLLYAARITPPRHGPKRGWQRR